MEILEEGRSDCLFLGFICSFSLLSSKDFFSLRGLGLKQKSSSCSLGVCSSCISFKRGRLMVLDPSDRLEFVEVDDISDGTDEATELEDLEVCSGRR